ncbi:hypothetical protein [Nitrosopumilus ureiphilus]|uniref:Uncharacterized protein n=1 Tax=Nitrosopumilus ureiphilus TaxID=1470067 RepID=A0A7D5RCS0_9ARCH|nr:hypothetical protein [Nitrosopumilus ureiphilus]QLH06101.1 hypothetical protein C5F50_02680 [Nitrosopumilus ureiphilus]
MTRFQNKKSVGLTAIMALIVLMAMGVDDVFGDHEADNLVHEFGELLEGVEAEILSIPNDTKPSVDTTDTMQTENILSQIVYVEAFDEVIRQQIL